MDLEHKLTIAKEELEKTALDKVKKRTQNISDPMFHLRKHVFC